MKKLYNCPIIYGGSEQVKAVTHILKNPKDTISFDHAWDTKIREQKKATGADGALLLEKKNNIYHVNLIEKNVVREGHNSTSQVIAVVGRSGRGKSTFFKALTAKALKPIQEEDSSLIFNQFLEILRHNVVSDKPNAFNKIFTLFLCKVYDEKTTKPNITIWLCCF